MQVTKNALCAKVSAKVSAIRVIGKIRQRILLELFPLFLTLPRRINFTQIEFLCRDARQFTGLMHCQSTDETKLLNHINLSLTTISVAKVAHWEQGKPFSMQEIKSYYHNLKMVKLFSEALGLDTNSIKNNPKIISILESNNYDAIAA